jgi:hypothetical protein
LFYVCSLIDLCVCGFHSNVLAILFSSFSWNTDIISSKWKQNLQFSSISVNLEPMNIIFVMPISYLFHSQCYSLIQGYSWNSFVGIFPIFILTIPIKLYILAFYIHFWEICLLVLIFVLFYSGCRSSFFACISNHYYSSIFLSPLPFFLSLLIFSHPSCHACSYITISTY